jgi:hypothetical protein
MNYWIHPSIKWKRFKELNKPFRGDIYPVHGDKMLWEMLRDRQINMYLSTAKKDKDDPMILTLASIPKKAKLLI